VSTKLRIISLSFDLASSSCHNFLEKEGPDFKVAMKLFEK
jgi:hypothetical protein